MPGGLTLLASTNALIPTPATGKVTIYFSTDLNVPAYKDDAGVVHSLVGVTGSGGPVGPMFVPQDGMDGEVGFPGPAGASGGGAPSIWTLSVTKASDDTVTNSNTLTSDSELVVTLAADGRYLLELIIFYSGTNVTADYKYGLLISNPMGLLNQIELSRIGLTSGLLSTVQTNVGFSTTLFNDGGSQIGTDAASTVLALVARGYIIAPTGGTSTLTFQFAQFNATVGNSVKTLIGSTMRLQKFA
jgi:hypothetical protein